MQNDGARRFAKPALAVLTTVLLSMSTAWAQPKDRSDIPNCSGMSQWGKERYLVTHDLKSHQPGPRLGVVTTSAGIRYQSAQVDWGTTVANDVESICPVDGQTGDFLLSESGYYKGQFGRLFLLHSKSGSGDQLELVKTFQMPKGLQEIEGLATLATEKGLLVLLGGRGGKEGEAARVYWGLIEGDQLVFKPEGLKGEELHLPRRLGSYARGLSDMYLDKDHHLWVAACSSQGSDAPSRSLIYQAGTIQPDQRKIFRRNVEQQSIWWVDGCKIEGLAPCSRPGFGPAYVTDDDSFGGIWRATPASPSLGY